jgi:hypothetical protein
MNKMEMGLDDWQLDRASLEFTMVDIPQGLQQDVSA